MIPRIPAYPLDKGLHIEAAACRRDSGALGNHGDTPSKRRFNSGIVAGLNGVVKLPRSRAFGLKGTCPQH